MKANNNGEIKNNSKRKEKNIKNKTQKKYKNNQQITRSLINLSKHQRDIVCKNYFNTYDTSEDKIEELFKKNIYYTIDESKQVIIDKIDNDILSLQQVKIKIEKL